MDGTVENRGGSSAAPVEALAVGPADVEEAARTIRGHVRDTPVVTVDPRDFAPELAMDGEGATPLSFKLELLQHAGSFKARGAFNNLLTRPLPPAGVVAASGGNHGAAVALAAGRLGVPARIFVPAVASPAKIEAIRGHGAELVVGGERYADAALAAEAYAAATGALPVHAYDSPETLAGQGTVALEWSGQAPDLDTMLVAVGGGGLIGGMAAWARGRVRLVAVEPETAPTLHRALRAGEPVDAPAGGVAADSLAPRRVGRLTFPLAAAFVERAVLVPDAAIVAAQRALWRVIRVVAEPGGAAAFAALLSGAYRPAPGERVGVLLCGGNSHAVRFDPA